MKRTLPGLVAALLIGCLSSAAVAQSTAEFAVLACRPVANADPQARVVKKHRGFDVEVRIESAGPWRLFATFPSKPQMIRLSPAAGLLAYFQPPERGRVNGWYLVRLSDGGDARIVDTSEAPYAACLSADGRSFAYTTWESEATQIDTEPVVARIKVWQGDLPDDREFVPRRRR
jgi:hypothetical protein